jgi:hypothetical protein
LASAQFTLHLTDLNANGVDFACLGRNQSQCFRDRTQDPAISLDSSVTNPDSYSLLLSNDVGNSQFSATAPEPASMGLIAASQVVIAGILLRRRSMSTHSTLQEF